VPNIGSKVVYIRLSFNEVTTVYFVITTKAKRYIFDYQAGVLFVVIAEALISIVTYLLNKNK